jgi:hypothetical protein
MHLALSEVHYVGTLSRPEGMCVIKVKGLITRDVRGSVTRHQEV